MASAVGDAHLPLRARFALSPAPLMTLLKSLHLWIYLLVLCSTLLLCNTKKKTKNSCSFLLKAWLKTDCCALICHSWNLSHEASWFKRGEKCTADIYFVVYPVRALILIRWVGHSQTSGVKGTDLHISRVFPRGSAWRLFECVCN